MFNNIKNYINNKEKNIINSFIKKIKTLENSQTTIVKERRKKEKKGKER